MMPCQRAVPIMPGSFPSSYNPATALPGSEAFSDINEGDDIMAEDMMQGTFPGTGAGTGMGAGAGQPGAGTAQPGMGAAQPGAGVTQPGMGAGMPQTGMGTTPGTITSPFETAPGSPTILDTDYTQGYLKTQIGKRVLVTFLLGTSTLQDRSGILETVGVSYIIIREPETNRRTLCDIYSIKFVSIVD